MEARIRRRGSRRASSINSPGARDLRDRLRILFLPFYRVELPSSRYRVFQLLPHLETAGVSCRVLPAPQRHPLKRAVYAPRLFALAPRANLIFVQKRILPRWVLDAFDALGKPYVFDLDDAVFQRPAYRRAMDRMTRRAAHVIAGNERLAEYARARNPRVTVIPTVVEPGLYGPPEPAASLHRGDDAADTVVLGWTGTNPNRGDFEGMEPVLDALATRFGERVRLRVVSNLPLRIATRMAVEFVPWSLERGYEELRRFDIGLMPLPDTEWNRGKCGLKLIEYMATGLPSVASPVGANVEIVTHEVDGLIAASPAEWVAAVERLVEDPTLRRTMGARARRTVEERYSFDAVTPRYLEVFRSLR